MDKNESDELIIANKQLAFQNIEKENRAAELKIANEELAFQNKEKENRAIDLVIANKELAFQNQEKEKRAAELVIANQELKIQNKEKENRAADLVIANKELAFQNEEKEKRAAELVIANKELAFQNEEKENRAAELNIANRELAFQNLEKEKRAEELITANEELAFQNKEKEKRAIDLAILSGNLQAQREELRGANDKLHEKAEQLTLASKFKSEFLANMSHELRTPLNSLLILAQHLYENQEGNLTDKQISYAKTIHSCGNDLTQLINDILDLSKIESGFISAELSIGNLSEIASFVETTFKPISEAKNLKFKIEISNAIPEFIETDTRRLNQILKNLLSNAFKFTEKGEVKLSIFKSGNSWNIPLKDNEHIIAFSIEDTGIGVSRETQGIIFEAFQQAEGSTSRKYGGTGLGLSISKGLAELLGGTIILQSEIGKGSTFTLYLPIKFKEESTIKEDCIFKEDLIDNTYINSIPVSESNFEDDRQNITIDDRLILINGDGTSFINRITDIAHKLDLKVVRAIGFTEMYDCIKDFKPIAVILEISKQGTNGWEILKVLKNDIHLHHIPVHIIAEEENVESAMKFGAHSFRLKTLSNEMLLEELTNIIYLKSSNSPPNKIELTLEVKTDNELTCGKKVLVVDDDMRNLFALTAALESAKFEVVTAESGMEALEILEQQNDIAIILMDIMMPEMDGYETIQHIRNNQQNKQLPIIAVTAKAMIGDKQKCIASGASDYITKPVKTDQLLSMLHLWLYK